MKISIALATYNGSNYLEAQLESILNQSSLPNEIVITDDYSTDSTLEIIVQFASRAPFKVIWSQNPLNLGYSRNFNAALMKTTGDLVFLSDQDDVWFPEKIKRMTALAKAYPKTLLFMNDAALTDENLTDTGLTKLGQILSAGFSEENYVMGCCVAVRRELLDLCLPIPGKLYAHDNWIVGIADGLGRKLINRQVLQYYRRHGNNESQSIVNRTTRVTRRHVWTELLIRIIRSLFNLSIVQCRLRSLNLQSQLYMIKWINEIRPNVPEWLRKDFDEFKASQERKFKALNHGPTNAFVRFIYCPICANQILRFIRKIPFSWSKNRVNQSSP